MADASFDINRYSLGIELALSTAAAERQIDNLGEAADRLQQRVSQAAQQALKTIGGVTDSARAAMTDLNRLFDQAISQSKQLVPPNLKIRDAHQDVYDQQLELQKLAPKQDDQIEQQRRTMDQIRELQESQNVLATDMLQLMRDITQAIGRKNRGHDAQNDLMEQTNQHADDINRGIGRQRDLVYDVGHATRGLLRDLITLRFAYGLINQDVERYYTANYRVLGSQIDIVRETTQLTKEYGVLREAALETYEALGSLKIPRQEMGEYGKAVALTNRVTGVAIGTLADYVGRLRAAGFGAQGATRQLAWMGVAMRQLRLNTQDMTKMLQGTTVSAMEMATVFREGSDAPAKIDRLRTVVAGLGKEFNMSSDGLDALVQKTGQMGIQGEVFRQMLADMSGLGRQIKSVDDVQEAITKLGQRWRGSMVAGGDAAQQASYEMEVFANTLGTDSRSLLLLTHLDEFRTKLKGTAEGAAMASLDLASHAAAVTQLEKSYAESTQSVTRQMSQIGAKFQAMFFTIQYWVEHFLGFALGWIVPVVNALGSLAQYVAVQVDAWDSWLSAIIGVPGVLKTILGGVVILGTALTTFFYIIPRMFGFMGRLGGLGHRVGGVFAGVGNVVQGFFRGAATAFTAFMTGIEPGMRAMGRMLLGLVRLVARGLESLAGAVANALSSLLTGLGTGLQGLFTGMGRGLAILGGSVTGVLPQLLGLGAAFVLVGAGAWLLAQAVSVLATQGTQGLVALGAMTLAISLMGAALVGLAYLAAPVAPVLLAIGATMLMIGGAAWLLGAGLKMAAEAWWRIVDAIGPHSPPMWEKMVLIAAGTLALTAATVLGVGPLLLMGVALGIMAGAAWLLNAALGGNGVTGAVSLLAGRLKSFGPTLQVVQRVFSQAFRKLLGFATGLLTGVWRVLEMVTGAITGGLRWAFGKVVSFLGGLPGQLWDAGKSMAAKLWNGLMSLPGGLVDFLGWLYHGLVDGLVWVGRRLYDSGAWLVGMLGAGLRAVTLDLPGTVASLFAAAWDALKGIGGKLFGYGSWLIQSLLSGIVSVPLKADALLALLSTLPGRAWELGRDMVAALGNGVGGAIGGLPRVLAAGLAAVGGYMATLPARWWEYGVAAVRGLAMGLGSVMLLPLLPFYLLGDRIARFFGAQPGTMLKWGRKMVGGLTDGLRSLVAAPTTLLRRMWGSMIGFLSDLPGKFAGWGRRLVTGLVDGILWLIGRPWELIKGAFAGSTEWFEGLAGKFLKWGVGLIGGLVQGITSVAGSVYTAVAGVVSNAGAALSALPPIAAGWAAKIAAAFQAGVSGVRHVGGQIVATIGGGIQSGWGYLGAVAGGAIGSIKGAIANGLGAIHGLFGRMFGSVDVSWVDSFLLKVRSLNVVAESVELAFRRLAGSATMLAGLGTTFTDFQSRLVGFVDSLTRAVATIGRNQLGEAIGRQFAAMESQITTMVTSLDKYGGLLENAASRVEAAVLNKAIPAMLAAREAGIEDVVRAETIATVQVKDNRQESEERRRNPELETLERLENLMGGIAAVIAKMSESRELAQIAAALETYLPDLASGGDGGSLHSEYNNWGR